MKYLKLIPIILKNLFLMIWESKLGRWMLVILVIAAIGWGGFRWYKHKTDPNNPNISLSDAARIGQITTHKLMVQIENRNCPPEIASGCYERGDIVLIAPGDKEFSDAEKSGFLILNMDLTDKQAEVLVSALTKNGSQKGPDGETMPEQLKMRKYAVDLSKTGMENQTTGKVVDTVYKWDVVKEK